MGTRAYRRDKRGRFAGAGGGGTTVTYGKAGGGGRRTGGQKASAGKSLGATAGTKGRGKQPITAKSIRHSIVGKPNSMQRREFTKTVVTTGALLGGGLAASVALNKAVTGSYVGPRYKSSKKARVNPPGGASRLMPSVTRHEGIPMSKSGVSLKDAAKAAAAASKPAGPNYSAAVGRKDYVGRRVTDGNWGFVMKAAKAS